MTLNILWSCSIRVYGPAPGYLNTLEETPHPLVSAVVGTYFVYLSNKFVHHLFFIRKEARQVDTVVLTIFKLQLELSLVSASNSIKDTSHRRRKDHPVLDNITLLETPSPPPPKKTPEPPTAGHRSRGSAEHRQRRARFSAALRGRELPQGGGSQQAGSTPRDGPQERLARTERSGGRGGGRPGTLSEAGQAVCIVARGPWEPSDVATGQVPAGMGGRRRQRCASAGRGVPAWRGPRDELRQEPGRGSRRQQPGRLGLTDGSRAAGGRAERSPSASGRRQLRPERGQEPSAERGDRPGPRRPTRAGAAATPVLQL